jgi:hypothetical protein
MKKKKQKDLQKITSFYVNKRSRNQKPIREDRRENTSSSSSDLSSLFLHMFYATYVSRLEEMVFIELQPSLIQT